MDERKVIMLKKIRPERHLTAVITLEYIKYIKEECKKNKRCTNCKYYNEKERLYGPCLFSGEYTTPNDWNEYEITERMYRQ